MPFTLKTLLLPLALASCLSAQEVLIDSGATQSISSPVFAASYVWKFNGDVVADQTTSTFTYSPIRKDVGTHWLKLEATLPSGAKSDYHWRLRVRIPLPTSSLKYYVATDGSDADPGTLAAPFATLEKARDVVRALPRPLPAGGVTVFVRGGTYRRTATFNLTSSDSGTEAAPVFYKAYTGETPKFTSGTPLLASAFGPLDASMQSRVATGVTVSNIRQLDLAAFSFANDGPFPVRFNQNRLRNPYYTSVDGEIFELFFNGARAPLSRYPNDNLADRFATPCLKMDGVTQKYATTLNGEAIGGQFKYKATDAARVQKWITAANEGSLWIQGFYRVPWEEYGMKVKSIDTTAGTFTMASGASMSLGYGNKYSAYEGSKTEPYWALNLLEEIDQPGEWAIDFIRNKLYLWPSATIADGSVEISDFSQPLVKLTAVDHTILQGLTFDISLAQGVLVSGGSNNLVLGCKFRRMGSYAVDLENGSDNGVLGCDMEDMAAGGVYLRGGDSSVTPRTSCNHFVVNNDMLNIANVCKIYAAGVDVGFGGQAGTGGGGGAKTCVGARVAHNRITNTHHVGILHGSFDKTIEYNNVENFCVTNNDMGGVYSFQSAAQGGFDTIRFNQFTNKRFTWGEYLTSGYGGAGIQVDGRCEGSRMFGNIMETRRTGFTVNTSDLGQIFNNQIVNNAKGATSIGGTPAVFRTNFAALGVTTFGGTATGTNKTYSTDPGIISRTNNDYRLNTNSTVYADLPLWQEIPVEMIGLFNDEIRSGATTLKPVIDNPSGATNIGQFGATLNGQLDFPLINQDTTVRVYWGTGDGGSTAGSWQNNTTLGIKTRGKLEAVLSGLSQQTTYYYRYYASNSSGAAWASASRSFTTAGPPSTKANNTNDLNLASSWTNNALPAGGLGIWDSTVTAANTTTIGTGLTLLGIQITNPGGDVSITPGTSGALTLGSGGIDLSTSTRLLSLSAPVVLSSDQTWITGSSGAAKSTQITASGVISGTGELHIAGTADRGVALTGANTFSGGLVLEAGGRVVAGNTTATSTASSLGKGALTINGGVISTTGAFGLNEGITNPQIWVNNDFALEPAGRIMIAGTWDLGGSVRTASCLRTATSNNAIIAGGNTSWGLATVATVPPVVANGALRVTRSAASNYVSFRMNNSPAFLDNAGLTIGPNVISVLGADLTNADPTKFAALSVESGGYFGLCENATTRNATISSLSGDGEVGNYNTSLSTATANLTINGGAREDSFVFSGRIVDSNPAINTTAGSNLGKVNVVKSGTTIQSLAGANTYTGTTVVSGGTLDVSGSIASPASLSVQSTARLTGNGTIASPSSFNGTVEPTGALSFSSTLSLSSTGRYVWNLAANTGVGAPKITAGNTTITAGATMDLNFSEFVGSVNFNDPFWSTPRGFSILIAPNITGNLALGAISADSAGNASTLRGAFSLVNSGTAITLQWYPFSPQEAWRYLHFGIYTNTGDAADTADPDGDGFTNLDEFTGGTDPNDTLDYPGHVWINPTGPAAQLWSVAANWSGNLVPPSQSNTRLEFLTGVTTATAAITAQNNLPGTFTLNRLVLGGTNSTGNTLMTHTGNAIQFSPQASVLPSIDFAATGTGFTHDLAMGITLNATTSIRRTGTGNMTISGPISGAGGLNVDAGTGIVLLTGANSYSGVTTIETGTLKIGNDGATGTFGTGAVVNNGTLRIERTGTIQVPNEISGTGNVIVSNPGSADIAVLGGNNSFTGGVTITGGARITNGSALGSGVKTISLSGGTTSNLRFDGSGGAITLPATFSINSSNPNGTLINEAGNNSILGPVWLTIGAGSSRFISQAGTLTLAGTVKPNTTGRALDLRGAGNGVISGGLSDGTGSNTLSALTKNEAGTWTLSGTNTYTGNTTVSGGTLAVTGSLANVGSLTVSNGATFSGNGTFGAASTITGTLAPGLTTFTNSLGFAATSAIAWKCTANSLSAAGRVTGATVAVTAGSRIDLVFNSPGSSTNFLHSFWRSPRSWTVLSATLMTGSFALGTISPDAGGRPASTYGSFSLQQSATGVTLNWTPLGGFPNIDDPAVSRVSPVASPVAVPDLSHALRVAVSASGGGNMSFFWTQASGPGATTFSNNTSAATTATFSVAGRYVLRCTATNEVGSGFTEFIVDVAPPQSVSLRQGVNGYEHRATMIRADTTTWNSGARNQILIGKANNSMRALFSFDLETVPRTWSPSAVTLDLWTADATSGTVGNLSLRQLTRNFVEGTGDGVTSTNGAGTGATWATYNGSASWTAAGGDYQTAADDSTIASFSTGASGVQKTFPSTAAFLSSLNSALSAGSALNLISISSTETGTTNIFARFASDDHATETLRPRLNILFSHNFAPTVDPGTAPAAQTGVAANLSATASNASATTWSLVSGPGTATFGNSSSPSTTVIFSQTGNYLLRFSAANANGETSRNLAVTAIGTDSSTFSGWQAATWPGNSDTAIIGDYADPDHDGVNNLLEWALHLDPNKADVFAPVLSINGSTLEYTYTRRKTAPGEATYQVSWSDTLGNDWSSLGVSGETIVSATTTSEAIKVSVPRGTDKRFLRIRISRP